MNDAQDRYPQNDPDRARGLISDAQGEFVQQHPGGAFDPRTFRSGSPTGPSTAPDEADPVGEPPMDGESRHPARRG
ncbi:hypothetical protein [Actinoplanes sp. DH11]|uniref:hypothetical protein n=1 Tax=Actinoplanes sp. DH11 TaxID=2857011 RepID=UPI001E2AD8C6|nr:hypothetical protein [Actinoplanes sp. DH11]